VRVVSPSKGSFLLRLYEPLPGPEWEPAKRDVLRLSEVKRDVLRLSEVKRDVLRLSEVGLRSQMLWLSDIRRTVRLPVPEPVPTADGSFVGCTSAEGVPGSLLFVLLRWIPGVHKKSDNRAPSDAFAIGSYIAKLHGHAERYSPPNGFARPRWDWDYLFGESALLWRFGEALFSEDELEMLCSTSKLVRGKLLALGEDRSVFGMIHRDLHPGTNILFHQGVVYAIDFDHCGWGYYLYDLARTYILLGGAPMRMRETLLEGYQSERALPDNYREALELFVTMRLVEKINVQLSKVRLVPPREIPSTWKTTSLQPNVKWLTGFLEDGIL
jgi:Ser/Thr protein kinase RdoA (MazF antagonist)